MIIHYIEYELTSCGFKKEKKNTGYIYSKTIGNIELICFIESNVKLYFISIYRWNDNRVRGSYCISSEDIEDCPDFSLFMFKKTIHNMPRYIGREIDVHSEIIETINETFVYK